MLPHAGAFHPFALVLRHHLMHLLIGLLLLRRGYQIRDKFHLRVSQTNISLLLLEKRADFFYREREHARHSIAHGRYGVLHLTLHVLTVLV